MKEHDKLELSERSRPNGNAGGAWESRVVKFADSYEILDPQEAPDFRGYARILRKRMPTVLIVFIILFSISLIATLKQKPVYRAQVLLEIQKENPDIPTIQELYELDSVSDAYLRSQYTILGSESLARSVIDKLRLDTVGEFNAPEWWSWRWRKKKNVDAPQVFAAGPARADREVYGRVLERFEDRLKIDPINRSRLVTHSVRFPRCRTGRARGELPGGELCGAKPGSPVDSNAKGGRLAFAATVGSQREIGEIGRAASGICAA